MKTQQGMALALMLVLLAANNLMAQEPQAAQQTLTFPPQQNMGNQVQYPGVGQQGVQFPNQAYVQQQLAYPSTGYAYPGYSSYTYGQQPYGAYYAQYYSPYAYPSYSPYAMVPRMTPYALRPPVPQNMGVPQKKKETHPWGDTRYIWPDFYTDFTGDAWDKMINAPFDMGRMPGGWRFPSFSSPDPVTVSDAIANQVPPFAEEAGNMVPLDDVGNMTPFKF
ncbi:MAG: hypothetical protein R3E93_02040 [Thiothrix sp.]